MNIEELEKELDDLRDGAITLSEKSQEYIRTIHQQKDEIDGLRERVQRQSATIGKLLPEVTVEEAQKLYDDAEPIPFTDEQLERLWESLKKRIRSAKGSDLPGPAK